MSVDPLADKYPNVTPYLYCNGNPVMLVDPDGREVTVAVSNTPIGYAKIQLFSGPERKRNSTLSGTVVVPFYTVTITNESGSSSVCYFTRIGYRGNAGDPKADPREVTFDVQNDGDTFQGLVRSRWGGKNNVLELRDKDNIDNQTISGKIGSEDATRTAIQFHVLGATDGCLMAVGANNVTGDQDPIPDMPATSSEMQKKFMNAVQSMQTEDLQNNKGGRINVSFEQIY